MQKSLIQTIAASLAFALLAITHAFAYEPPRSGLMIDVSKNSTIYNENASELRHPASLTKMMTLYMVFEALRDGKVTLDTPVIASRHSADRPPSRLGHAKGEIISLDLAIDALVVRSANDVSAAVAELLGETEEEFAELMTVKARQLGMKDTIYRNASGLPNKEQVTTARDQAILGLALKNNFPEYYHRFNARTVSYKERTWNTHNNLVKKYDTVTGIKTGFINASGFNIVTYAQLPEGDRIIVVMGGRSAKERDQVAIDLLEGRTPFHRLDEDQQKIRSVEVAKRKAAEKKLAAEQREEKRKLAALKKQELKARQAATEPAEQPAQTVVAAVEEVDQATARPEMAADRQAELKAYAIQVGALPTQERALERLALARPSLSTQNLRQYTVPLETSNGTVFRARIIGFSSMSAAFDACKMVEAQEIECMALIQK